MQPRPRADTASLACPSVRFFMAMTSASNCQMIEVPMHRGRQVPRGAKRRRARRALPGDPRVARSPTAGGHRVRARREAGEHLGDRLLVDLSVLRCLPGEDAGRMPVPDRLLRLGIEYVDHHAPEPVVLLVRRRAAQATPAPTPPPPAPPSVVE